MTRCHPTNHVWQQVSHQGSNDWEFRTLIRTPSLQRKGALLHACKTKKKFMRRRRVDLSRRTSIRYSRSFKEINVRKPIFHQVYGVRIKEPDEIPERPNPNLLAARQREPSRFYVSWYRLRKLRKRRIRRRLGRVAGWQEAAKPVVRPRDNITCCQSMLSIEQQPIALRGMWRSWYVYMLHDLQISEIWLTLW